MDKFTISAFDASTLVIHEDGVGEVCIVDEYEGEKSSALERAQHICRLLNQEWMDQENERKEAIRQAKAEKDYGLQGFFHVKMFGETRLCWGRVAINGVNVEGTHYDELYWIERPEDGYGVSNSNGKRFLIINREDWLQGQVIEKGNVIWT